MHSEAKQYHVTGMTCAACSAHVEKAVRQVTGVTDVSVNLLTNSMQVSGTADAQAICAAVQHAGYGATPHTTDAKPEKQAAQDSLADTTSGKLLRRLIASVCVLLPLMYLSMGHMMWGFPLPAPLANSHSAIGLAELILSGILLIINQNFFRSGILGLLHRAPNMDTLVALGAGASFVYSTCVLFGMLMGNGGGMDFYFESAGMIVTLITLGKLLEAYSKGKTTNALRELMKLTPQTATILTADGSEQVVPVAQIRQGDRFVLRSGDSIPADGTILEGSLSVDESALTGESLPVDREEGGAISAATICRSGYAVCEATRVGQDTTLAQIIRMVSDASAGKAPIAKLADKVSGIFVPAVLLIAAITITIWLLVGETVGFSLARGISVLVISCPCALGLATPVAIMVGSGKGARNGILFKTAAALESAGRTEIVALDKTGTLTNGTPTVTDVLPAAGYTQEELLVLACSLEQKSEHPLARAIVAYGEEHQVSVLETSDFQVFPGNGIAANCGGKTAKAGNAEWIGQDTTLTNEPLQQADQLASEGKTPLYITQNGKLIGLLALADTLKDHAVEAVSQLKGMGIHVVMMTGDHRKTAEAIGKQAGVDEIFAQLLPADKEARLRMLSSTGKTAMVGDGINDAPALTRADLGIAIGAGTDVAVDAADVVLVGSSLQTLPAVIRLGRRVLRNIRQNLFWAFFYNAIGIPLAAGVWIPLFGWQLQPMFGAAAMSLSSFCVVTNALRLNLGSVYDTRHDHKPKHRKTAVASTGTPSAAIPTCPLAPSETPVQKTLHIEGMMCAHCEQRIQTALERMEQVSVLQVSSLKGIAVVTCTRPVDDSEWKTSIENAGYTLTGIE